MKESYNVTARNLKETRIRKEIDMVLELNLTVSVSCMKDNGRRTRYTDSEGGFILMGHFILASGDTENEMVLVFNIFRMDRCTMVSGKKTKFKVSVE